MEDDPTFAVWLLRSMVIVPDGMVVNVMLSVPLEYVWLLAVLVNVRVIVISGGASPRTLKDVPQDTDFSFLLVQYGLS